MNPIALVIMDINYEESARNAADIVENRHGRLDVLINNAAVMRAGDTVASQNLAEAQKILDTNVISSGAGSFGDGHKEFARYNILVNAVCPDVTNTENFSATASKFPGEFLEAAS